MSLRPVAQRTLLCHAHPQAFAAHTVPILGRLGYEIVDADDERSRYLPNGEERQPDLILVDERRLAEIEDEPGEKPVPVVVLTGRHGVNGADPRVMAAIKRPAGLHEIYRVAQQLLEDTPRSAPRIPTHIQAGCRRRGRDWDATVISLSENGCLLRSPVDLPLGTEVSLRLPLPTVGTLAIRADTAYQLLPDIGLVFSGMRTGEREAIRRFVSHALA